jgi:pilus assembly protein CpaF
VTDHDIVRAVCELVADRPGDPTPLVRAEVRRLAPLSAPELQVALADRVIAHLRGLGELDTYVRDDTIDEVLVNAGRDIWIDRDGELRYVGSLGGESVDLLIERVLAPLGRRVDRSSPIVDARLADGARICAVLPPVAVDGPLLSIRTVPTASTATRRLHRSSTERSCCASCCATAATSWCPVRRRRARRHLSPRW